MTVPSTTLQPEFTKVPIYSMTGQLFVRAEVATCAAGFVINKFLIPLAVSLAVPFLAIPDIAISLIYQPSRRVLIAHILVAVTIPFRLIAYYFGNKSALFPYSLVQEKRAVHPALILLKYSNWTSLSNELEKTYPFIRKLFFDPEILTLVDHIFTFNDVLKRKKPDSKNLIEALQDPNNLKDQNPSHLYQVIDLSLSSKEQSDLFLKALREKNRPLLEALSTGYFEIILDNDQISDLFDIAFDSSCNSLWNLALKATRSSYRSKYWPLYALSICLANVKCLNHLPKIEAFIKETSANPDLKKDWHDHFWRKLKYDPFVYAVEKNYPETLLVHLAFGFILDKNQVISDVTYIRKICELEDDELQAKILSHYFLKKRMVHYKDGYPTVTGKALLNLAKRKDDLKSQDFATQYFRLIFLLFSEELSKAVKQLVETGWDVNFKIPDRNETFLAHFVKHDNIEMVRFLLEKGAYVFGLSQENKTLFQIAEESPQILALLNTYALYQIEIERAGFRLFFKALGVRDSQSSVGRFARLPLFDKTSIKANLPPFFRLVL